MGSAGQCWAVLGCAGQCWAVLGCAGQCWAVLGSAGHRWAVLGSAGQCWASLGSAGQCWAVLGSAGQCWAALGTGLWACAPFMVEGAADLPGTLFSTPGGQAVWCTSTSLPLCRCVCSSGTQPGQPLASCSTHACPLPCLLRLLPCDSVYPGSKLILALTPALCCPCTSPDRRTVSPDTVCPPPPTHLLESICLTAPTPLLLHTRRLAITPTGNLAITDGSNTTQWSTQTACLAPASAAKYASTAAYKQAITLKSTNITLCLHEPSGNFTLEDAATGAAMWSSSPPPCSNAPRQLTSHSRSAVQCVYANQPNLTSQDCGSHLSLGSGPLTLTGPNGLPLWSGPTLATPVRAPAGLCLQPNGSLVYSGAGGAARLWSSPAAGPAFKGPFSLQIRDGAVQVSSGAAGQRQGAACTHACMRPDGNAVGPSLVLCMHGVLCTRSWTHSSLVVQNCSFRWAWPAKRWRH